MPSMDQIFCDASIKNGICGIAAVIPCETISHSAITSASRLKNRFHANSVRSAFTSDRSFVVFFSAFPCTEINEGELKAIDLAVTIAEHILSTEGRKNSPVEISSDSLNALTDLLCSSPALFRGTETLRTRIREKGIILSKVKAHAGHSGNSIADEWSKTARKKYEKSVDNSRSISKKPFKKVSEKLQTGSINASSNVESSQSLLAFTRGIIEGNAPSAVITRDGRIVPRIHAITCGEKVFMELCKERVWA